MTSERMAFERVPAPDVDGRRAMYFARGQDQAYRTGAYAYLDSIAMAARMATIAAYLHRLEVRSILDVGCGTAELLAHLHPDVAYLGVDIAPSAISHAERRFAGRAATRFHAGDFRDWEPPEEKFDAVVWAGIGFAWTLEGQGGQAADWLSILAAAEAQLRPGGWLVFELVTPHLPIFERLIEGRYRPVAAVDLDCFQSEESPRRSIRVVQTRDLEPLPATLGHRGSSLVPGRLARELIRLAGRMGQATDADAANLGYGYIYYGLVRLARPETIVCVGSYRGFAPICLALGAVDNGAGRCFFIDPGKVDGHWHDEANVERLRRRFDLGERWVHLRATTEEALDRDLLPERIDLLLIDGDHRYDGVKFDFDRLGSRVPAGGLILLHDASVEGEGGFTPWEVQRFLRSEVYGRTEYETFTLPFAAGLALVRKRGA